jgi:hypothetical protein
MALDEFVQQTGEKILYRSRPNHAWYLIAGKILIGLVEITALTVILDVMLSGGTRTFLAGHIPDSLANVLVIILFLGLVPLLSTAWVAEDIVRVYVNEYILTDRRLWVKGSPYAWSQGEILLEDIASMTFRRDAVFVRQKSNRKVQVHLISDGKLFVKAYEQFTGKNRKSPVV